MMSNKRSRSVEWVSPNIRDERYGSLQQLESCLFYDCAYGPEVSVKENPNMVADALRQIEREIDQLSDKSKEAYFIALEQDIKQKTNYVRSERFLLGFLRVDRFNVPKAAKRAANFLKHKLHLFGPEKLPHRITQEDLNDDDKRVLKSGFLHFVESDCGGRPVAVIQWDRLRVLGLLQEYYAKSICRVTFYVGMSHVEDNEICQRKGAVAIRWNLNSPLALKDYRVLFQSHIKMILKAMPVKLVAVHSCVNSAAAKLCCTLMDSFNRKYSDYLVKIHGPSMAACFAGLSKYGIDVDSLCFTPTGDFKEQVFAQQLQALRQNELTAMLRDFQDNNPLHEKKIVSHTSPIPQSSDTTDATTDIFVHCGADESNNYDGWDSSFALLPEPPNKKMYSVVEANNSETMLLLSSQQTSADFFTTDSVCKNLGDEHLPLKLFSILERNEAPDAIWWLRDGTAFAIEKDKFPDIILSKEFSGVKMCSFLRRLRRWGFQRMPKYLTPVTCIEFEHPLFQKKSPQLLKDWNKEAKKDKFPTRLMNALDSNIASDAIWWVNDGKAFAIDRKKFSSIVLEKFFDGLKFASFQRSLLRWEFKQLKTAGTGPNVLTFHHPSFQENSSDLMSNWSKPKK